MNNLEVLGVTDELMAELRSLHATGSDVDSLIWHLSRRGVTKPGVVVALRLAKILPKEESKERVHAHAAFAFRREKDEAFYKAALALWTERAERPGKQAA